MQNKTTVQTEFKVQIDQQCTIWIRSTKYINATSQQDADNIALNMFKSGEIFSDLDEYEYMYDTLHETETIDILNEQGNTILKTY
jgi:hypothetical protein